MSAKRSRLLLSLVASATLLLVGCDDDGGTATNDTQTSTAPDATGDSTSTAPDGTADIDADGVEEDTVDPSERSLCVGVRGNGTRIFSHFGALARIHEHYGPIDAIAGGSSGSISSFFTESIYANPHAFTCGGALCTDAEAGARISLLFKSIPGYFSVLSETDEVQSFLSLAPLVQAAQEEGIGSLFDGDNVDEGLAALNQLLNSPETADLVNDEVLDLMAGDEALFHAVEVWDQLSTFGAFAVDSPRIFLRPGILDFGQLADKIGRIGSFYAAYGPSDAAAWNAFLDACAEPARGLEWAAIAPLDAGNGTTCGDLYADLATTYREAFLAAGEVPNRIQDPVGTHLDALVVTAVLTGDAVPAWQQGYADYIAAREYSLDVAWSDVSFGYFGQADDLATVEANAAGFTDAKTAKFYPLGPETWRVALSTSPAEPGLARGIELGDVVSIGGWPDLEPTLALENLGCDDVVLVTREGDVRTFGFEVAQLLGIDQSELDALYDMDTPTSAVVLSLEAADGVWCTDWDGLGGFDFGPLYSDGYSAPFETSAAPFTAGADPYANISADLMLPGCSPGLDPQ